MHVLMISLDSSMATKPNSNARLRHIEYAAHIGKLTVVVYTPNQGLPTQQLSDHFTVIPTNSPNRMRFITDAIRLAQEVIRADAPDLITTQDPFSTGWVGWWLRRQVAVPLLIQNHCYFIDNQAWLAERPLRNRLMNALGKFTSARADAYRTVNHHERETWLQRGGDPRRVFTHALGTASEAFAHPTEEAINQARHTLNLAPDDLVMLWVGYPVPFKRVPLLFEVFKRVSARLPQAKLVLIGDKLKSAVDLDQLAHSAGIHERVVMYGPVPHHELPAYYALAQAYVITSAYEGVPRVLMEASAAGLPLVGFDRVGVSEIIQDGINGYLLAEGDIDGMAEKLAHLLTHSAEAQQLGASAQQQALERFSATRNLENVLAMWHQTVELGTR